MNIKTAYKFEREELKLLDVFEPSSYEAQKFGDEPWLEALIYLAYKNNNKELLYCLNGDSTTCGDTAGANVLILMKDFDAWSQAAQAIEAKLTESKTPLQGGRYGDEHASIDLAQSNETFYWIDEIVSPVVASQKAAASLNTTD